MSHDSDKKDKKIGATELVVSSTVIGLTASAAAYQKMKESISKRSEAKMQKVFGDHGDYTAPEPINKPNQDEPAETTDFSNENDADVEDNEDITDIKELSEFEER